MYRPKAISFDLDDTLWPIAPVMAKAELALADWLIEHCPEVAAAYPPERMRAHRDEVWQRHPELAHDFTTTRIISLREALFPFGYMEMHVEAAFEAFLRARNEIEFFPDAVPALERLKQKYRLISISNGNADTGRIGLSKLFEFSLHAREHGRAKPARCIFEAAARRLGLDDAQIMHVGDHPEHDVDAAVDAGMSAVWIDRGLHAHAPSKSHLRVIELGALSDWLGV